MISHAIEIDPKSHGLIKKKMNSILAKNLTRSSRDHLVCIGLERKNAVYKMSEMCVYIYIYHKNVHFPKGAFASFNL